MLITKVEDKRYIRTHLFVPVKSFKDKTELAISLCRHVKPKSKITGKRFSWNYFNRVSKPFKKVECGNCLIILKKDCFEHELLNY